jgi:hypothetical protein
MAPPPRGVLPSLLLQQVRNTADWAFTENPETGWIRALTAAPALDADYTSPEARPDWLRVLLSAHQCTVGTFVPTDVDSQIRHHVFTACRTPAALRALAPVVAEVDAWDPRPVSARTVTLDGDDGVLSGHAGEWLSVQAGALGRALALRCDDVVDAQVAAIEAELGREARAVLSSTSSKAGGEVRAACIIVTVAHNLGDLSRVVEAWPEGTPRAEEFRARYVRLGHENPRRYDGAFVLAGEVNKAVMAVESHRYLPLRLPRALRTGRALLLPFPPFLDAWGDRLARELDASGVSAVVEALLEGHAQYPRQVAWARALRGLGEALPGGLDRVLPGVPARLRKLAASGPVKELLGVPPDRFEARFAKSLRAAVDAARQRLRGS